MKTSVAIFIGGYLPAIKYGGPVTSIANLVDNLGDTIEFYIITHDHDMGSQTKLADIHDGWNTVGKAKVLYIPEKSFCKSRFKDILKEIRADIVYLSSVFYYSMNFPAIIAAKSLKIPVILAPRGELCEGALTIGKKKKLSFLYLERVSHIFDHVSFHVTSEEESKALKKYLNISLDRIFSIPNMPSSTIKRDKPEKKERYLKAVFISRIVKKKNLLFAIKQIKKCQSDVVFYIYGPIEDNEYWEQCLNEMKNTPENVNVIYKGILDPGDSQFVFNNNDVFVFPTLSENYGHVIAEAITSLCPVIISKSTTPWDDIEGNGSFVIDLADKDRWTKTIDMLSLMSESEYRQQIEKLAIYVEKKFNINAHRKQYVEMFDSVRQPIE